MRNPGVGSVAGDITLDATGEMKLVGSYVFNNVQTGAVGKGGNIDITTGSLSVTDRAYLEASTYGQGDAGSVFVQAKDSVSVANNSYIFSNVESGAVGNGGNINISAATLSLLDSTQLQTLIRGASDTRPVGRGNAGNVNVDVTGALRIARGAIFSSVESGAVGKGGNINITSGSLSLTDGAQLQASTSGQGDAGSVFVKAKDSVSLANNSYIFSNVESGAVGKGGNINITSGSLSLTDGAQLQASTFGQGDAGSVFVQAKDSVTVANNSYIDSTVESGAVGKGGNIDITTGSLSVKNGARLSASTAGRGDAGSVTINARDQVSFDGVGSNELPSAALSNVEEKAIGNAGNIKITAGSVEVNNGAQLESRTRGQGNAASVTINARDTVSFNGSGGTRNRFSSGAYSSVESGAVGKGGNIDITTGSLSVTDGARLSASTAGRGDGGSLTINARDQVSFDGVGSNGLPSAALNNVEEKAIGNAGNIKITAGSVEVSNGAQLESRTRGQGNAASVTINARDTVSFNGNGGTRNRYSGAYSTVESGAVGKGGNIDITTGSLSVTDGAYLGASTYGQGDAGSVFVQAKDSVSLANNSYIFSNVESGAVGNGGNINIATGSLYVTNGAQLNASTDGKGDGGSVIINASKNVSFDSSTIFSIVGQTGEGKSGGIRITADSLFVTNGASLNASTDGKGDGGSVIIDARKSVSFDGVRDGLYPSAAFGGVGGGGEGKGGGIHITTGELSLTNGAQLQASTGGIGDSGNVIINASKSVSFDGVIIGKFYTFNSYAASRVYENAQGKGGNIHITTGELSLTNGAQVFADTSGKGDAGNIQINAKNSVSVSGTSLISGSSSALFTSTNSTDKGGNIIVDTSAFRTLDGGVLNAQTFNDGDGGSITVRAKLVEVLNGGQLLATSSGNGRAGKITVNATDQVIVNGSDATYLDRVEKFGTKVANTFGTNGVNNVNANSGLFVRSESLGSAGDIEVISPQIRLDNSGRFIAESTSGNGGNITLGVRDLLLLRRGSLISTNAGTAQQGGNGGNIIINAPNGFIVAVPNENSDITANAYTGIGGRVQINASGIYGTQFRERPTPESDITASSELGVSGTVELNTPEIDPNSGLINLPTVPIDTELAQGCYSPGYAQSSFVITGRGGLPPNPKDVLSPDAVEVDWVTLDPDTDNRKNPSVATFPTSTTPESIVEATGWVFNAKGEVVFTNDAPTITPRSSWQTAASCRTNHNDKNF